MCKTRQLMATAPCLPWIWWSCWPQMLVEDAMWCYIKIDDSINILYTQCSLVSRVKGTGFVVQVLIPKNIKSSEMDQLWDRHRHEGRQIGRNLNGNRQGPLTGSLTSLKQRLAPTCSRIETCGKHLKQQTCFGTRNQHRFYSEVLCSLNSWVVWVFQTCFPKPVKELETCVVLNVSDMSDMTQDPYVALVCRDCWCVNYTCHTWVA